MSNIIVIPGLGDQDAVKKIHRIVDRWNDSHTKVHVFDSKWHTAESADDKHARLIKFYDENTADIDNVYVVAFSAGGALAIHLFTKRPTAEKVILISAKLKGAEKIGPKYVTRAPNIIPAVQASEKALDTIKPEDRHKFICYRPILDGVVPRVDMSNKSFRKKLVPFVGHASSIGFALLFLVKKQLKD